MSTPSPVTPRTVSLLKTGLFVRRPCNVCGRQHLALAIAPRSAPCLVCVRAAPPSRPPPPPPGRRWSPLFLAHIEAGHARTLATRRVRSGTAGAEAEHTDARSAEAPEAVVGAAERAVTAFVLAANATR